MKRVITTVVAVTLSLVLFSADDAFACRRTGSGCSVPLPSADSGGVGYTYESRTEILHPREFSVPGGTRQGPKGTEWQTKRVRHCDSFTDPGPLAGCVNETCQASGELGYETELMRRRSAGDEWQRWPGSGNGCTQATSPEQRPVTLRQIEIEISEIIEQQYRRITRPKITVQPQRAIVNLPILASTPQAGPVSFSIVNPLPGRVTATPSYTWTWSNSHTSTGPGRAYDGTNPAQADGHYPVQATYRGAGGGSVNLTATWAISLTLDGIPPITDIDPLVHQTTADFSVRNAKTVLVD